MYISIYIYTYIHAYIRAYTHACIRAYIHAYIHTYVYRYAYVRVCTHKYFLEHARLTTMVLYIYACIVYIYRPIKRLTDRHTERDMYIYIYVCTYACMYTNAYVHIDVYIYIYGEKTIPQLWPKAPLQQAHHVCGSLKGPGAVCCHQPFVRLMEGRLIQSHVVACGRLVGRPWLPKACKNCEQALGSTP